MGRLIASSKWFALKEFSVFTKALPRTWYAATKFCFGLSLRKPTGSYSPSYHFDAHIGGANYKAYESGGEESLAWFFEISRTFMTLSHFQGDTHELSAICA